MKDKVVVIYHRSDLDGKFCREIAKNFFNGSTYADVEYIGWNYGDPVPTIANDVDVIYLLDLSIEALMNDHRLIWIDHHATAMKDFSPNIAGYRIDGVAACRLTWQYFFGSAEDEVKVMPEKEDYVKREVKEPLAVRLAGEYDIWDRSDPRTVAAQYGMKLCSDDELGSFLTYEECPAKLGTYISIGEKLKEAAVKENLELMKHNGFTLMFHGLMFLACNVSTGNSQIFEDSLKPIHDGCMMFYYSGERKEWKFSLYGVPSKPDIDLSLIAKKYGGGGHKLACGFSCKELPFALPHNDIGQQELIAHFANNIKK